MGMQVLAGMAVLPVPVRACRSAGGCSSAHDLATTSFQGKVGLGNAAEQSQCPGLGADHGNVVGPCP